MVHKIDLMAITTVTQSHHPAGSLLHLELEVLLVVLPHLCQTRTDLMGVVNPRDLPGTHNLTIHLVMDPLQDDMKKDDVMVILTEEATEDNVMTIKIFSPLTRCLSEPWRPDT